MSDTLPTPTPAGQPPATDPTAFKAGLPAPPPPAEPLAYRPISGFAVAGFIAAALFAFMVLAATVVALYQGAPFFYPVWVVVVPAGALVLSLVARSQIRNSEGTRAGESLAGYGIWISLLTGLGYFVYYYVTGLAITSQANDFLTKLGQDTGFLPHLQKAADPNHRTDLYYAFLYTLPVASRSGARPEDEPGMLRAHDQGNTEGMPGAITQFRKHYLLRFLASAPDQVKYEALGVQSWEYESRAYKVSRIYRITTPEAALELSIPVQSSEGEAAGDQRRWFLVVPRMGRPTEKAIKRTPLGEGLKVLRNSAIAEFTYWKIRLNEGQSFDLKPFLANTPWQRLGLAADQRDYAQRRLEELFASTEPNRLPALDINFQDELVSLGGWKITPDKKIQIEHLFKLTIGPHGDKPPYYTEGSFVLETKQAVDPLAYIDVPNPVVDWKIHDISFFRVASLIGKKGDKVFVAP
jgi:hypothetical protein